MAVAYFQAHLPRGFWPVANGGELAAIFCFVFLYFAAAGAGKWSLDALRKGSIRFEGGSRRRVPSIFPSHFPRPSPWSTSFSQPSTRLHRLDT